MHIGIVRCGWVWWVMRLCCLLKKNGRGHHAHGAADCMQAREDQQQHR